MVTTERKSKFNSLQNPGFAVQLSPQRLCVPLISRQEADLSKSRIRGLYVNAV